MRSALLIALVLVALCGCTTHRPLGPYTAGSEAERNPARAEQLNQKACDLIDIDPKAAEGLLRQALAADLYHGPAHNNLGTLLLKQGNLYGAAGEYEWAKRLLPGHPDPRMNLALTLERAGRVDEAVAAYRTALEVYPEHIGTMEALARLQVRAGRVDSGTANLLSAVAMRGETKQWREWARLELVRRGPL